MSTPAPTARTAGVFDVRTIIGLLLAIYGVILAAMGVFGDPALDKTGGINANLFAGLALLATGALFLIWVKLRPIVVDQGDEPDVRQDGDRR